MKSLIQRFEDAVKANGYRTCSDATRREYEEAKKALEAALTAAPASAAEPVVESLLEKSKQDGALLSRYHMWCVKNGCEPAASDLFPDIGSVEAGEWHHVATIDEMHAFYLSRLPAIRKAAREHGYAIGVHGSLRRDFDLIAMRWHDGASDKDTLAHAIAMAACGISRDGPYEWEQKPSGRVATSFPICWTEWHGMISAGHIDLSLIDLTIDT